jgi:hypothetical protein
VLSGLIYLTALYSLLIYSATLSRFRISSLYRNGFGALLDPQQASRSNLRKSQSLVLD